MKSDEVIALRQRIQQLLQAGHTPAAVARQVGCSRTTVYKVMNLDEVSVDRRADNPGRPRLYAEAIRKLIEEMRVSSPANGPQMLYSLLMRNPERYGIQREDVPSPSHIALLIRELGLAHKPVGPRDKRLFPDAQPTEPGVITVDTWGPWQVRADNLYLATVQDRFTRLAAAIPAVGHKYPSEAENGAVTVGLNTKTWAKAIWLAQRRLCNCPLRAVYTDNGVGMVPAWGTLPEAVRTALLLGARVIFIPPAQPWRNGRLERFHWSMEREHWRQTRPANMDTALSGLVDWLNYYNFDRPHRALGYKAPADTQTWATRLEQKFWADLDVPDKPAAQVGTVEAIRMVYNDGRVDTWGQMLTISPALAGQFVRVQFAVTGEISTGQVIYQQRKNEDIVVARFRHTLDAKGLGGPQWQLYHDVELLEFEGEAPKNQRLDEEQLANQQSRVMKRRSRLERDLAGQVSETGTTHPR